MAKPDPPIWTRHLGKNDLHDLISRVKSGDAKAIERAVEFIIADSLGMWHNRARAKLCRYFKNVQPDQDQKIRLVEKIKGRLVSGKFHEQFYDQLRMAIVFDAAALRAAAEIAVDNDKRYIRKYAKRVLTSLENQSTGQS